MRICRLVVPWPIPQLEREVATGSGSPVQVALHTHPHPDGSGLMERATAESCRLLELWDGSVKLGQLI